MRGPPKETIGDACLSLLSKTSGHVKQWTGFITFPWLRSPRLCYQKDYRM